MKDADLLRKAAQFLRVEGWHNAPRANDERGGCLMQAVAIAKGFGKQDWNMRPPQTLVEAVLLRAPDLASEYYSQAAIVYMFNDRHCLCHYTALAVLEEAAQLAEMADARATAQALVEDLSRAGAAYKAALGSLVVLTEEIEDAIPTSQAGGGSGAAELPHQLRGGGHAHCFAQAGAGSPAANRRGPEFRDQIQSDASADYCT